MFFVLSAGIVGNEGRRVDCSWSMGRAGEMKFGGENEGVPKTLAIKHESLLLVQIRNQRDTQTGSNVITPHRA